MNLRISLTIGKWLVTFVVLLVEELQPTQLTKNSYFATTILTSIKQFSPLDFVFGSRECHPRVVIDFRQQQSFFHIDLETQDGTSKWEVTLAEMLPFVI